MQHPRRTILAIIVLTLACVVVPLNMGGCDQEAAVKEFRQVAADGLSTGLQSVLDAIVQGVFAVVEPNDSQGDSSSSSGSG